MMNSTLLWFLFGLGLGTTVGVVLEDTWEMMRSGMAQIKKGHKHAKDAAAHPHVPMVVICVFAAFQIFVGLWVGRVTLDNIQYQRCTYEYDQQFNQAYTEVSNSNRLMQQALFEWLNTLPPLFVDEPTETQVQNSREKLQAYILEYNKLLDARADAEFPHPPQTVCGLPPSE